MASTDRPRVCKQCGRPLPGQHGRGRIRLYCNATCRSAARRQRSAPSSGAIGGRRDVKNDLTDGSRQEILDIVPDQGAVNPDGPATQSAAEAARALIRQSLAAHGTGTLEAIGAARAMARDVERELATAVARAREAGHTWEEIGQVLGTSRQAAFQRFGRPADPRTGRPMAEAALPDAADRALVLFADLAGGRWQQVCAEFDDRVAAKLDADGVAGVWAQITGFVGGYERHGEPVAYQAGDYTVVDIPLFFEAGERIGRVSYDHDARVAGLFFLTRGQV
jgi:hypothetical protein